MAVIGPNTVIGCRNQLEYTPLCCLLWFGNSRELLLMVAELEEGLGSQLTYGWSSWSSWTAQSGQGSKEGRWKDGRKQRTDITDGEKAVGAKGLVTWKLSSLQRLGSDLSWELQYCLQRKAEESRYLDLPGSRNATRREGLRNPDFRGLGRAHIHSTKGPLIWGLLKGLRPGATLADASACPWLLLLCCWTVWETTANRDQHLKNSLLTHDSMQVEQKSPEKLYYQLIGNIIWYIIILYINIAIPYYQSASNIAIPLWSSESVFLN